MGIRPSWPPYVGHVLVAVYRFLSHLLLIFSQTME